MDEDHATVWDPNRRVNPYHANKPTRTTLELLKLISVSDLVRTFAAAPPKNLRDNSTSFRC
jgi:hypothetical protein